MVSCANSGEQTPRSVTHAHLNNSERFERAFVTFIDAARRTCRKIATPVARRFRLRRIHACVVKKCAFCILPDAVLHLYLRMRQTAVTN